MQFETLDLVILGAYVIIIMWAVVHYSGKTKNVTQYFLADRSLPWFIVGAALFSTDISAMAIIGLAGTGHASGLAVSNFVLSACVVLVLLGWFFTPFYLKTGVMTIPEFLERRFNKYCRLYLSIISILAYVLTKVSVTLLAGSLVLKHMLGWDIYTSALVIVLVAGLFTLAGGSNGIFRVQFLQAIFLIIGSTILLIAAWQEVGGLEGIRKTVPVEHFNIFKAVDHPEFPWPGMVFGAIILGIWYWTTDQYIVQITLSAKNIDHARTGTIWGAWLRLLPIALLVLPGIIAKGLYPELNSSDAYVTMVNHLLSPGIRAVVVLSVMAALMSSLSSSFNATATLFTLDIYSKLYPQANGFILVNIGRIATFVMVILGIIWVPFISAISDDIYRYVQNVQAYIAPPICVVFMLGMLWPRANGNAALTVLIAGFALGAIKFVSEILYHSFQWNNSLVVSFAEINFLYYAIFVFLFSTVLMVVVSYMGPPPAPRKIHGFTIQHANKITMTESFKQSTGQYKRINIIATIGLILVLAAYWIIFG